MAATTDPVYSDECGMRNLPADLRLEICSYLEVNDQRAMGKVSKWWRLNLPQYRAFFSQYVELDCLKLAKEPGNQEKNFDHKGLQLPEKHHEDPETVSEDYLEHVLNICVIWTTKVLVLRHVDFNGKKFGIVARLIEEKECDLIRLIFKDCEVQEDYRNDVSHWWMHPQRISETMLSDLPSIQRVIMDNATIRNIASGATMSESDVNFFNMPCCHSIQIRLAAGNMFKKLPIVVPRLELDCSQPASHARTGRLFHSFITAVNAQCPEVSREVREDIRNLFAYWTDCTATPLQWATLRCLLKCLNRGMLMSGVQHPTVDNDDLRHLDPLTFNRLTTEILHRMYCLPPHGLKYTPDGYDRYVSYEEY